MKNGQPGPMQRCVRCKTRYQEHVQTAEGVYCPNGSNQRFRRYGNNGASQSFTPDEVAWLDAALRGILMGSPTPSLANKPETSSIARKIKAMKETIARTARAKTAPP